MTVERVKLTRMQRVWFEYAAGNAGLCYNPYSMPKAVSRWRKMVTKSETQGFITRRTDQWARLRGGGFDLTEAGRAALEAAGPLFPASGEQP